MLQHSQLFEACARYDDTLAASDCFAKRRRLGCVVFIRGFKNLITYFFLFLTIVLTIYGQIIIKARAIHYEGSREGVQFLLAMFLDLWVLSALVAALSASATWMMAVRNANLSVVYPVMALPFVVIPVLAAMIFGEKLGWSQMVGLFLIVLGVGLSARTA